MVNTKFSYIIVEGQHDLEVIGKILSFNSIERVRESIKVDSFWQKLIPKNFPPDGDLMKRVPVPAIFQDEEKKFSIAVHEAIGESKIVELLSGSIENLDLLDNIIGLSILTDSDDKNAKDKFNFLVKSLGQNDNTKSINWSDTCGIVSKHRNINTGIYVFPDNDKQGTLEDILLKCGQYSYPLLFHESKKFVDNSSKENIIKEYNKELKDFKKPAGKNKAIISCVGNIFKPGKSIQVSLKDNKWITEETKQNIKEINDLYKFINKIIDF